MVSEYEVDWCEALLTLTNITRTGEKAVIARAGGWQTLRNTRHKAQVRGGKYNATSAWQVRSLESFAHLDLNYEVASSFGTPLSIDTLPTIVEAGLTAPTNTYVSARCAPFPDHGDVSFFWYFSVDADGDVHPWRVAADDWTIGAQTNEVGAIILWHFPNQVATVRPQVDLEHAENLHVQTNKTGWSAAARRHIITRVDLKRHNMRKTGGDNR